MRSSFEEIAQALERFRSHRLQANRIVLEKIIPMIERATVPEDNGSDDERTRRYQKLGVKFLEEEVVHQPLNMGRPGEFLERWDDFKHIVDGTLVVQDEARRVSLRAEFFSEVEAALKEKAPEELRESITFPDELRLLLEQVDGVCGPGLAGWNCKFHGWFLDGSTTVEREVPLPYFQDNGGFEELEVAIGIQLGDGIEIESWAIFSRTKDEPDEPWEWRYVVYFFEFGQRIFDTIPDALDGFASLKEPDEEDMLKDWDGVGEDAARFIHGRFQYESTQAFEVVRR
ncbi:hypothetical protein F5Y18DRAFT_390593 [Xylariaceae sp. FL1019]|nr:hypothetical protein F5Y18DRAFT_390593 [Xylariaceae sp. FL1019]